MHELGYFVYIVGYVVQTVSRERAECSKGGFSTALGRIGKQYHKSLLSIRVVLGLGDCAGGGKGGGVGLGEGVINWSDGMDG